MLDRSAATPCSRRCAPTPSVYDEHEARARPSSTSLRAAGPRAGPASSSCSGSASTRSSSVDPQPGEDADLRAEDERLGHADGLRGAAAAAHVLLAGDEEYAGERLPAPSSRSRAARAALAGEVDHDPALPSSTAGWPRSATSLPTSAAELGSYVADVDVDPARLAGSRSAGAD